MVGIRASICSCTINIERETGLQQAVFEKRAQNFGFEGFDEDEDPKGVEDECGSCRKDGIARETLCSCLFER